MNDDGLDIPECLKVDPSLRGKGAVTTGFQSREALDNSKVKSYKGRMLPKTMSPEAWEIIKGEEKREREKTTERIRQLKERLGK